MGSVGELRLMHASLQQQHQQLLQSIDLQSTISSTNSHISQSATILPMTTNDHAFVANNNKSSTNDDVRNNTLCHSENDDINSNTMPNSLNFIIDKLSKVRDEISSIENEFGHKDKSASTMFALGDNNLQQDVENNHNISNNGLINILQENQAALSDKKSTNNTTDAKAKNNYKNQHIMKSSCDTDNNQNNCKDSTIPEIETTSSSASSLSSSSSSLSSTSMSSVSSSLTNTICEQFSTGEMMGRDNGNKNQKEANIENDSKRLCCKQQINACEQEKISNHNNDGDGDGEDDDDETIDVDDLTMTSPKQKSTNGISFIDRNDKTTLNNDDIQPMIEGAENSILILKQLMDKRIELKRLDKMVFNLITHHLMKITSGPNQVPINYETSKSIHSDSCDDISTLRLPQILKFDYNDCSSIEDFPSLHSSVTSSATRKNSDDISTTQPSLEQKQQPCTSIEANNSNSDASASFKMNDYSHVVNTKCFPSTTEDNFAPSVHNTNQSLIDLTSASSRHTSKLSAHNNQSISNNDNVKQTKSTQNLDGYHTEPKSNGDSFYSARQKILDKIHLGDYDKVSNNDMLKLTRDIYGLSEKSTEKTSNTSRGSKTSHDDCASMMGLNLKTTNNNICTSVDRPISLLQNISQPIHHTASTIASTSFSLQAMASLNKSHFFDNTLNHSNTTTHLDIHNHRLPLDLLNLKQQNNINCSTSSTSNVALNNDLCLNYSSHHNRGDGFYASPYKQINNTSAGLNDIHLDNGNLSLSVSGAHNQQHYGESLLRPPQNKKFRASFSEKSLKLSTNSHNSNILNNPDNNTLHRSDGYMYEQGALDFIQNQHQTSDYRHDLDLSQKYCHIKLSHQQFQNNILLTDTAVSPPSSSASSTLLAFKKQHQHHLNYHPHDFTNSLLLSSDHNNDNGNRSNICNIVENGNSINNNNSLITNNGTCRLVCHVCGSGFEDRHRLQQHLSIHLQLKPEWYSESTIKETMAQYEAKRGDYLCGQCDVRFDTTAEFDKHMQLHGDKPHRCELCFHDNSFRYWRQYLTHFRNHCFVYHCRFVKGCNHQCNRRDYLKSHILKHHLDNRLPEQYTG